MTQEQVEEWSQNPDQYVADEEEETFSVRVSGELVLDELMVAFPEASVAAVAAAVHKRLQEAAQAKVLMVTAEVLMVTAEALTATESASSRVDQCVPCCSNQCPVIFTGACVRTMCCKTCSSEQSSSPGEVRCALSCKCYASSRR